jgi:hypothetical protein
MELIKDYDLKVHYHPGKDNVGADALSSKAHCNYLHVVHLTGEDSNIRVPPDIALYNGRRLTEGDPKVSCFHEDDEGTLWFKDRIVVPCDQRLRKKVYQEAHTSKYSIHPSSTKMYHDLKAQFWWTRMKRETARYVAECDTCRRIKADHLRPTGLLQPLNIPTSKWEDNNMDFIMGVPLTTRKV